MGLLKFRMSGQVAASGGDVLNDSAVAHVQAGRGKKAREDLALQLDGERIFVIKYRAIDIRIVEGEMATSLERSNPNSWRIFPQTRGKPSEKAEVIEALLEYSDYTGEGELILNGDEETFVKFVEDEV